MDKDTFDPILEATFGRDFGTYQFMSGISNTVREMLAGGEYTALDDGTFIIRGTDVHESFTNLIILFTTPEISNVSFDSSKQVSYWYGHTSRYDVIGCGCLRTKGDPTYIHSRFNSTSFIHELTHYLDDQRAGNRSKVSADATTSDDYFNNPMEFNAHYSESAMFLLDTIMKNETLRVYLRTKINSYDAYHNYILKQLDAEFVAGLNETYRKKLNKRIYTMYPRFMEELNKSSD